MDNIVIPRGKTALTGIGSAARPGGRRATVAVKLVPGRTAAAISPTVERIAAERPESTRERATMVLKAPGILTYMLSVILTVLALVTYFFGASIPYVTGQEFWVLVVAQIVLIFGCIMRGL
jgi:hypothetical protein